MCTQQDVDKFEKLGYATCLNDPYYHGAPNEEIGTKQRYRRKKEKSTTLVPILNLVVLQLQDELKHF